MTADIFPNLFCYSGVVQAAVRNYINLNIGEQLGRFFLLIFRTEGNAPLRVP
jgi:hypothetical protein